MAGGGMLLFAVLLIRDQPGAYGLRPDGIVAADPDAAAAVAADDAPGGGGGGVAEPNATLREAMHTVRFWAFLSAICVVETLWCGVNFNLVAILGPGSQMGATEAELKTLLVVMTVVAPTFSLCTGAVIEHARAKARAHKRFYGTTHYHYIATFQMALATTACALLATGASFGGAVGFAVSLSATIGVQDVAFMHVDNCCVLWHYRRQVSRF